MTDALFALLFIGCELLTGTTLYFRARKIEMTEECMRLAAIANAEVTAHEQLKSDLKAAGWVRLPTNEQIEAGAWH
jgi:hypothetical protein